MTRFKQALLTITAVACSILSQAQNPSNFKLGEEELSGIDIYNILQDKDQNYWLATDNGLIKYDGYTFKKIPSVNALSTSVFDLKLDYDNDLFCKNLSGQIFKVVNDSSKVYFQIPDSLIASEICYAFDNLNKLTIASNSIFSVNKNKEISFILQKKRTGNRFYQLLQLKDSSLITHNVGRKQFIKIKANTHQLTSIKTSGFDYTIQAIYFNNKLLYFDKSTGKFLKRNDNYFEIDPNFSITENKPELIRIHSDSNNLWVAQLSGGIKVFNKELSPLFNGNTFFKNNIISSFFKDNEGNILLGTFGQGLIVIPNINMTDIKTPDANAKITRITSTPNSTMFFGTQDGKIFKKDKNLSPEILKKSGNKHVELLHYINQTNELLIFDKTPILFNLNTGKKSKVLSGAVKDVEQISKESYIVASNDGVHYLKLNKTSSATTKYLYQFTERTNCVNFNPTSQKIYAGNSQGLKIGTEKEAHFFKLKGLPVICRDILYFNQRIYITTKKNGVLIFKDDQLIDNWTTDNYLISNSLTHIKSYENKILLATNLGIQILNEKGKHLATIDKSQGLYANRIIDFEIQNNMLWLVHQKGLQMIDINSLSQFNHNPTIKLNNVIVNDSIFPKDNSSFSYSQNKFQFFVSSNSIKYKAEIKYHHQLVGIDNGWQTNNYSENKIEYKSLPPGDYTFKLKAKCRDSESKTIDFKFTITPPFWNTWLFYLVCIFTLITLSYLIFKREIKKQRKKLQLKNELNTSKLIAIQSQMNPHFIFNAINSIQDLILKGDIDNSYNYIIKFAKLVRQTLNFSDKEFIDIEDEIELLKIYLELEKLRFKDDFEYSITCSVEDIKVPPMLVQPFVENAIKHGLLHKEGLKKLSIHFSENGILQCSVIDNGIGRKKAQDIKARQQKNHHSFSVNATKSRFKIMKSHYKQDLGLSFEDLEYNGRASGTKVIISMPFKQDY
tara:strand:+ start:7958 stop:10819 length:2862 start_codon:yes stop_codon:yes gene_type:complete